jgi:FkbM family methyltransferase
LNLEIIKKYYEPKSILDIGANVGQFYNKCKSIFTDSYYYLIEGNLKCEEALKQLNVDYSMSLISDEIKEVDFYTRIHEEKCTGNSIYREKTSFFDDDQILLEKRLTSTLNDLLPNKTFDLIKIDVQGSELDIINGGIQLIKESKMVILEISLVEYNEGSPTKEKVYEKMFELGFKDVENLGTINHPLTYETIQQDILFINKNNLK